MKKQCFIYYLLISFFFHLFLITKVALLVRTSRHVVLHNLSCKSLLQWPLMFIKIGPTKCKYTYTQSKEFTRRAIRISFSNCRHNCFRAPRKSTFHSTVRAHRRRHSQIRAGTVRISTSARTHARTNAHYITQLCKYRTHWGRTIHIYGRNMVGRSHFQEHSLYVYCKCKTQEWLPNRCRS